MKKTGAKIEVAEKELYARLWHVQGEAYGYIEIGIPPGWNLAGYLPPYDRLGRFPRLKVVRGG